MSRFIPLLALAVPITCAAGESSELQHNPFRKPALTAQTRQLPSITSAGAPVDAAPPVLRATLVGGETPLVLVGDRVVAIGATINGFKLIAVHEGSAVFERDGVSEEVEVKPAAEQALIDEESDNA